jgi:hypothetical protein
VFRCLASRCSWQACNVKDAEADKRMRLMIQNTISRYMDIMSPKLHGLVQKILERQIKDKGPDQVRAVRR